MAGLELQEFYEFPLDTPSLNSATLLQLLTVLGRVLLHSDSWPFGATDSGSKKRPKRLFDIDEFSTGDFDFSGELDIDKKPHGNGTLSFINNDVAENCFRGDCERSISFIVGQFDHGHLHGLNLLVFRNGDVLRGEFLDDSLHGATAEFDGRHQLKSFGHYDSGRRIGLWWDIDPVYRSIVYGPVNDKGQMSGDQLKLIHYGETDFFALGGSFSNKIKAPGPSRRIPITDLRVSEENLKLVFGFGEPSQLQQEQVSFYEISHVKSKAEKFLAQSCRVSMASRETHETKGAFRNRTLFEQSPPERPMVFASFAKDPQCEPWRTASYGVPGALRTHYFACYPGSGSKWIMSILGQITGLASYGCVNYQNPEKNYVPNSGLFEKTHLQHENRWKEPFSIPGTDMREKMWSRWSEKLSWRLKHMSRLDGRAVLLIRNPYEAIISLWNHERSGSYDSSYKKATKDLAASLNTPLFLDFAKMEIGLWLEINLDFLSLGTEILVVHFENAKTDWRSEFKRVHEYLRLPWNENRAECVDKHDNTVYHRKASKFDDPYTPELHNLIENAIQQVQKLVKTRGQPELPLDKYKWRRAP
ncbi:hypothetical protein TCAL_00682 [Tigriopus californicus]|uniref:Sulfotransferase domain-containing protein n=1 Tax=Tigriopus californicus TaxID=6832 RepID=A0A553PC63_TIGCA|nr:hypothetical protein TCAL_00682 [Tigriopus californicus]|eukprot:TCALIF_00682-PA protein Name:"Similar to wscd1 WSC domain-containing protein 1 (Xenopus tropicalis)" AED:0.27 eAED:0.34 QI:0/-1/0/1/-1/1/1/0/586